MCTRRRHGYCILSNRRPMGRWHDQVFTCSCLRNFYSPSWSSPHTSTHIKLLFNLFVNISSKLTTLTPIVQGTTVLSLRGGIATSSRQCRLPAICRLPEPARCRLPDAVGHRQLDAGATDRMPTDHLGPTAPIWGRTRRSTALGCPLGAERGGACAPGRLDACPSQRSEGHPAGMRVWPKPLIQTATASWRRSGIWSQCAERTPSSGPLQLSIF